MNFKGIALTGATIAVATGLVFGGFALADQGAYVPPTEPAASATPEPTVVAEPVVEPTIEPTVEPAATPEPVAPVIEPAPAAPVAPAGPVIEPDAEVAPSSPIERNWPHFVPMAPQPPDTNGMQAAGYQLSDDGRFWFKGCSEGDLACSWSTN